MTGETLKKFESAIRRAAPAIIALRAAPDGIIITIPSPTYVRQHKSGFYKAMKNKRRNLVKEAVKKVLPDGTYITCLFEE